MILRYSAPNSFRFDCAFFEFEFYLFSDFQIHCISRTLSLESSDCEHAVLRDLNRRTSFPISLDTEFPINQNRGNPADTRSLKRPRNQRNYSETQNTEGRSHHTAHTPPQHIPRPCSTTVLTLVHVLAAGTRDSRCSELTRSQK